MGSLLGCVGFTVVGVWIILIANQSSSPLLYMLAGIASIGFFGVIGYPRHDPEDPSSAADWW